MQYNIVIGYDNGIPIISHTAHQSILECSSVPVNVLYLNRKHLPMYTRPRTLFESTEFSMTRFLTPYLFDYKGWTLFLDNDVIVNSDIKELFDYRSDKYAVMCVKHNQRVTSTTKFLNEIQTPYACKNWSSVMLFNNEKCKALSPDYVNTAEGFELHQFKWLESLDLVGDLPVEWNYLVDNLNETVDGNMFSNRNVPKLFHYTNGGPYYKQYENCGWKNKWIEIYHKLLKWKGDCDYVL